MGSSLRDVYFLCCHTCTVRWSCYCSPQTRWPPSSWVWSRRPPQPYSYQYGVHDEYSGANFAANENSDTKVVSGTYTVALPDGRIQTVKYTADDYTGYVADVTYEGKAVFPEVKPYKPPAI